MKTFQVSCFVVTRTPSKSISSPAYPLTKKCIGSPEETLVNSKFGSSLDSQEKGIDVSYKHLSWKTEYMKNHSSRLHVCLKSTSRQVTLH